ncbi:MAG TPA: ATP-dependent metallopeptidase FtsH/Yme1/Tma family protein, partial [Steroidobacteraceae bacterium]|nr:ATP-dependent metallopeptidase FtsH/Yme1/Tma family protein [Steroidobacteraceae bacterium]
MDHKQHFSIWYFLAVLLILLAVQDFALSPPVETLAYSDFKALLKTGKISDVQIGTDRITGTADLRDAHALLPDRTWQMLPKGTLAHESFVTARVPDHDLVAGLGAAKVRFSGHIENVWLSTIVSLVAPAVIFVAIWIFFMNRMGTGKL